MKMPYQPSTFSLYMQSLVCGFLVEIGTVKIFGTKLLHDLSSPQIDSQDYYSQVSLFAFWQASVILLEAYDASPHRRPGQLVTKILHRHPVPIC